MRFFQRFHAGLERLCGDVEEQREALEIIDPEWSAITNKPLVFPPSAHAHSANDITSGTLADARLSSNIPRLNSSNAFVGNLQVTGNIVATGLLSVIEDSYLNRNTYFRGSDYVTRVTVAGDTGNVTVSGNITGSNLSGTNTGDQTLNGLLPSQASNSGKYLTTNGSVSSWGTIDLSSYATTAAVAAGYIPLATSVTNRLTKRNGTTGLIQDTGITVDASNVMSGVTKIKYGEAVNDCTLTLGNATLQFGYSGNGESRMYLSGGVMYFASDYTFGVTNASANALGSLDMKWRRRSSDSAFHVMTNGGLAVRNFADSADTPLTSGDITASGNLDVTGTARFGANTSLGIATIAMANRGAILQMYGSAYGSQPLYCHAPGGLYFPNAGTFKLMGSATTFTEQAPGVMQIGLGNAVSNALGSLLLTNLTSSGTLGFTQSRFQQSAAQTVQTQCYDTSLAAWQETMKQQASPTGAKWSVFGATPIVQQTLPVAATDAATTQTLCNAIRTLLLNFGFSN